MQSLTFPVIVSLIFLSACSKSSGKASGKTSTSATSDSTNYDSLLLVGSNPFTNSQLQPQVAITSGSQMIFAIAETPSRISDSVFIFDTATNQWSVTEMPSCHQFAGVTAVDSLIILAGGQAYPNLAGASDVEIYTPSTRKWTTATLSQARYKLAAASAGPIAAFGGGQTVPGSPVTTVDLYNATTGIWTTSAISVPRALLAAAGAGTKIVFAGGQDNLDQYSDLADIYDTKTGLWTAANLSVPRCQATAAVVGNQLIFAGGSIATGFSDAVDIYDVTTGEWSASRLPRPSFYYGGAVTSGNLVCFLSRLTSSGRSDTIDIYNASTRSWSSAGILPVNRLTSCGAVAGNQLITMGVQDGESTTAYYYQLK
jgi:Kelch motif